MDILENIKSVRDLFAQKQVKIANPLLWMNCVVTPCIIILNTAFLTYKTYLGDPISCVSIRADEGGEFHDSYCLLHGTTSVIDLALCNDNLGSLRSVHSSACMEGDSKCARLSVYYQWVPLVLLMQAIAFYIPLWLWNHWERRKVQGVLDDSSQSNFRCGFFATTKQLQNQAAKVYENLQMMEGSMGGWAFRLLVLEFLVFINLGLQIYGTDVFLGHQYLNMASNEVKHVLSPSSWDCSPMSVLLPVTSGCTFNYYGSGSDNVNSTNIKNFVCVLPTNIWNQKFYLIYFFWLATLCFLSVFWIIYRASIIFCPPFRQKILSVVWKDDDSSKVAPLSDWLFVDMVLKNVTPSVRVHLRLLLSQPNKISNQHYKKMA